MAKKTTRKAAIKRTRRTSRTQAKKAPRATTRAAAREVAAGKKSVRAGVKNLSVDTFRNGDFSLDDMPRVVHDVLSGAVDAVDRNIPKSRNNVLREVFDGLSQGFNTVNRTAVSMMNGGVGRGKNGKAKGAKGSSSHGSHGDFLDAVSSFASRASRPVREELNSLVDRASRSGGGRKGAGASSRGRIQRKGEHGMMEDAADSVRSGVASARRTADEMLGTAGDFVNGMMGRSAPRAAAARRKPKPTIGRAVGRAVRKVTKPARKPAKRR